MFAELLEDESLSIVPSISAIRLPPEGACPATENWFDASVQFESEAPWFGQLGLKQLDVSSQVALALSELDNKEPLTASPAEVEQPPV